MGDAALQVSVRGEVDRATAAAAAALASRIDAAFIPGVYETIPAFISVLVLYDPLKIARNDLIDVLSNLSATAIHEPPAARCWEIPSLYHPSAAPDLEAAAGELGVSVSQLIEAHSTPEYHVYMLGFLPGFPYLGEMPENLHLPRKTVPHIRIPKGAVAIAGAMTGIYPLESPGGWNVIGITPVEIWDTARNSRPAISAGDKVVFKPVSEREFERLRAQPGLSPSPLP